MNYMQIGPTAEPPDCFNFLIHPLFGVFLCASLPAVPLKIAAFPL